MCEMTVGDTVEVIANPAQTGTIVRVSSLGVHSHIVEMNAGPLYSQGQRIAYYGNKGCMKLNKTN